MAVAALDLELDVFAGPFDLLMAVVLREEISLLEVELCESWSPTSSTSRARTSSTSKWRPSSWS